MATRCSAFFSFISILKTENLLVRNLDDFNIIWQKCSFGGPLLFKPLCIVKKEKHGCQGERELIFPMSIENLKNPCQKPLDGFHYIFYQYCSSRHDSSKKKNMAAGGGGGWAGRIFPIYPRLLIIRM